MDTNHNGYRSEFEARRVRLAQWREEFRERNEEHLAHGRERMPWAEFVQEKKYYADLLRQGEAWAPVLRDILKSARKS
jgi:predicted dithiol-disulfide oxidoreductase (DUF899 family)